MYCGIFEVTKFVDVIHGVELKRNICICTTDLYNNTT